MTHTYAVLEITPCAYRDIREKLAESGYQHAFHREDGREVIDMHGIAVAAPERLASAYTCEPETCECNARALRSILSIRCVKHHAVPQQNKSERDGAECGGCIAEERDTALAALRAIGATLPEGDSPTFESLANALGRVHGIAGLAAKGRWRPLTPAVVMLDPADIARVYEPGTCAHPEGCPCSGKTEKR